MSTDFYFNREIKLKDLKETVKLDFDYSPKYNSYNCGDEKSGNWLQIEGIYGTPCGDYEKDKELEVRYLTYRLSCGSDPESILKRICFAMQCGFMSDKDSDEIMYLARERENDNVRALGLFVSRYYSKIFETQEEADQYDKEEQKKEEERMKQSEEDAKNNGLPF